VRLPSLEISESEKRRLSEADVHSTLFDPDMVALGYPPRGSKQADGEHFVEQRTLAVRRLRSQRSTGRYDGLYLIGNSPLVLCEVKRYDALDSERAFAEAKAQLVAYARSEDFKVAPPFLVLYCGKASRNRFFRLKTVSEASLLDEEPYEELLEPWSWERIKAFHLRGEFAEEVVTAERLREILLHHLGRIESDIRSDAHHLAEVVAKPELPFSLTSFGRWLVERPEALQRARHLYERKVAEIGRAGDAVVEEIVTQAALSHLNKVFFLNLCEDRHLPGFYRIMREFLPSAKADTSSATAVVFLGLLRRRLRDSTGSWDRDEERAYRALRTELAPSIREHVIEQNSWWELIRVAFDLAEERFPLVYREDAYDYLRPGKETLAELVYDLSTKSFQGLTNRHVGDIYQSLLSARQQQAHKLGAFYTPHGDVEYMVSKLNLRRGSVVLDPCMGSGHFLAGIYDRLSELYRGEGFSEEQAFREIVGKQLYGGDIDTFATSLAAIRLFFLDEHGTGVAPQLYVHDMLLHSPARQGELWSEAERAVAVDPEVDDLGPVDGVEFDAIVGNPPYGARKPAYKAKVYERLYGATEKARRAGSIGTGDHDTYGMFIANAIERLREGGRLCFITNDSFRSLTTYAPLRRYILDRCRIVEILLTDTKHFEGVSFQFAGMAITTLERCSDEASRAANEMRLVDYVRDPQDFGSPPPEKVQTLRQEEYEALAETPFFLGVPREVFESAKASIRVRDVARGRQGLATADDKRFLAGIGEPFHGLVNVVAVADVAESVEEDEKLAGIAVNRPHWVPFAKGEGFGEYWRAPRVAIDWSRESVAELERRSAYPSGTARKSYFRNRALFFRPGLTYSVVSSGRVSARLMSEGWIFGHKGSAIFVEDAATSELFVLGYLNSALATYFMKRIVNATATADVGYVEKIPYRRPGGQIETAVTERVSQIVDTLKADPSAEIQPLRDEIDDLIFELFEIRSARDEVRHFYQTVGRAERPDEDQATSE
jgi:hypothetical protein